MKCRWAQILCNKTFRNLNTSSKEPFNKFKIIQDIRYHENLVHPRIFSYNYSETIVVVSDNLDIIITLKEILKHNTVEEVILLSNLSFSLIDFNNLLNNSDNFSCFDDLQVKIIKEQNLKK